MKCSWDLRFLPWRCPIVWPDKCQFPVQNFLNTSVATIAWLAIGQGLFAKEGLALFGTDGIFFSSLTGSPTAEVLLNAMLASMASNLMSGAVAERIDTRSYLLLTAITSGVIFPVVARSVWYPEGAATSMDADIINTEVQDGTCVRSAWEVHNHVQCLTSVRKGLVAVSRGFYSRWKQLEACQPNGWGCGCGWRRYRALRGRGSCTHCLHHRGAKTRSACHSNWPCQQETIQFRFIASSRGNVDMGRIHCSQFSNRVTGHFDQSSIY
jgi:hypothetical protein